VGVVGVVVGVVGVGVVGVGVVGVGVVGVVVGVSGLITGVVGTRTCWFGFSGTVLLVPFVPFVPLLFVSGVVVFVATSEPSSSSESTYQPRPTAPPPRMKSNTTPTARNLPIPPPLLCGWLPVAYPAG